LGLDGATHGDPIVAVVRVFKSARLFQKPAKMIQNERDAGFVKPNYEKALQLSACAI
jgi:hypothetical protein